MEGKLRGVEPFFYPGNSIGLLLVHGFTGSPSEMRFLGERLAAEGWTVLGVRLTGHGSTPEDLAETRWEDWEKDVIQGITQLHQTCDRVIGIGLSMGGLLVLHCAALNLLDGMVAMNAPILLKNWGARLARFYKPFIKYVNKPASHLKQRPHFSEDDVGRMMADQREENDQLERFVYNRVPVVCLDSLNRAIHQVRQELGEIKIPVLLMQSEKDQTVNPGSVKIIQELIQQVQPEVHYFPKSGHILPLGPERGEVAVDIIRFIRALDSRK